MPRTVARGIPYPLIISRAAVEIQSFVMRI
jgi:hypothetical protein